MYMSLCVCAREVVRHWQKHVANVQNDFIFFVVLKNRLTWHRKKGMSNIKGEKHKSVLIGKGTLALRKRHEVNLGIG